MMKNVPCHSVRIYVAGFGKSGLMYNIRDQPIIMLLVFHSV